MRNNKVLVASLTLLLLMGAVLPVFGQGKPRVAVQTIRANEVPKATASVCRSFVETALIKTEAFSIINTADIDEVLKAQEISLADCTDESCAIRIGKLLAAEQIVIGDLSGVGSKMALNLRLLDVASGKVLRAEVANVDSVEDLQGKAFVAAYSLAGMKYDPARDVAVKETGEIYVTTPDARVLEVYLDGVLKGRTPALLSGVPFGAHLLEAKAADFQFGLEVAVKDKNILEVVVDPKLLRGNVLLEVQPRDAAGYTLLIGGKEYKAGLIRDVPAGEQEVAVKGGGWSFTGAVTVKTGETARKDIVLQEVGELALSVPDGAKATAEREGKVVPVSAGATTLPVGSYAVVVSHPDYETYRGNTVIQRGKQTALSPALVHTAEYELRQAQEKDRQAKTALLHELKKQRTSVDGTRGVLSVSGWAGLGLGVIAAGVGAVLEGLISMKTSDLNATYTQYQAASVSATASSLWAAISTMESEIDGLRTIRNGSFIGAAASGLVGSLLMFLSPSTVELDRRITELEGALR